ncbi:tetratricopeptide (TPR) repeat protein [Stenotrophomonas rhizophila]|uniref:Tetratricopeptide (TPR) repeat protein n=1 Tax=Stenotrophomonas rhizophila TaxID=216778 RepID=A0AAP5EDD1_9GAMM|nr:hypothetical protein [Stenotrophomonas rhizophila]MDQ1107748.1 tetratricopeptide (TPR) repeat protein [Stenotrophomonas rhizophila]
MSRHPDHEDAAHAALRRVRREGRWWWVQAWQSRRIWRWALLVAVVVFVLLVAFGRPLANWFWNEPQVEQLLDRGDRALAAGRLSAADGSGAREWYQAALALDSDRPQARAGLARTARAALRQAGAALDAGDLATAQRALALARELQVPQRDYDAVARRLREHQQDGAGIGALLGRAESALQAQRLDGSDDSALPLFQQVLARAPNHLRALEGREDALSDLLQQARDAAARGDVAAAAEQVRRARGFDPGHVDLPASEAALNAALEARLNEAQRLLRRQRWQAAGEAFQSVLATRPDDTAAQQGQQRAIEALLASAARLAADFRFDLAGQALASAEALGANGRQLDAARQAITQARQAERALTSPPAPNARGKREVVALLRRFDEAQARGDFLSPPGRSAYDALREAQAMAPRDPRVRAAAQRLIPDTGACFEDHLRGNRVQAASACLEAWQTLSPGDAALTPARQRLAQRWLAIGSERLGQGDVEFATLALQMASRWGAGSSAAEFQSLQARLRDIGAQR